MLATAEASPILIKYAALLAGLLVVVAFGVRPALRHARLGPSARSAASRRSTTGTAPGSTVKRQMLNRR